MGLFGSDRHHYHNETRVIREAVPYEKTVHEHKAPTDDSIRILNEFQEKAKDNIIATIRVDTNVIKAIGIYYISNMMIDKIEYHIKFNINGTDIHLKSEVDRFEWNNEIAKQYYGFGNKGIFQAVHKKFSEVIALELMKQSPEFIKTLMENNGK